MWENEEQINLEVNGLTVEDIAPILKYYENDNTIPLPIEAHLDQEGVITLKADISPNEFIKFVNSLNSKRRVNLSVPKLHLDNGICDSLGLTVQMA